MGNWEGQIFKQDFLFIILNHWLKIVNTEENKFIKCKHTKQYLQILIKVKSMQRSGTEAIKTQFQPSKPKREITNITNSQNTKRTYGQTSEKLFPKR